jgi:hypothetical protein
MAIYQHIIIRPPQQQCQSTPSWWRPRPKWLWLQPGPQRWTYWRTWLWWTGRSPSEPGATKSPIANAHHVLPRQAGGPSTVALPRRNDQSLPSSPCLLPHLLNNDATVFVVVIVGPCCQDGGGGKKRPLLPMPPPPPTRGRDTPEIEEFPCRPPTATSTLTGMHVMDQPMREDNVEAGVPLTMTMMTMAVATTMVGAPPRCPTGLGTSSRPPSKRTKPNLAAWGSWRPPRWDQDWPGVGGARTPTTGPDNHRNPMGKKLIRA